MTTGIVPRVAPMFGIRSVIADEERERRRVRQAEQRHPVSR